MLKFTTDHEWLKIEGDVATCGITDHAQDQLGDVVFVELPKVGTAVKQGDSIAVVESVKAASDVYAPVSGTITEINKGLPDEPGLINTDPSKAAWFFKIKLADKAELEALMDEATYSKYIA